MNLDIKGKVIGQARGRLHNPHKVESLTHCGCPYLHIMSHANSKPLVKLNEFVFCFVLFLQSKIVLLSRGILAIGFRGT